MRNFALIVFTVCTLHAAAGVLGTVDLTDFDSYKHDVRGNTVAAEYTRMNQVITSCALTLFDKAGVKKVEVTFPEAVGKSTCAVRACDGTWALLQVDNTYYSVVLSTAGVTILGTASDNVFRYRFMAGKLLVSYIPTTKSCQVFDRTLSSVGAAATILGTPQPLNLGKYFYCEDDGRTQIWSVKKELTKLVDETGRYEAVYEPARLCCIKDDNLHKICKY